MRSRGDSHNSLRHPHVGGMPLRIPPRRMGRAERRCRHCCQLLHDDCRHYVSHLKRDPLPSTRSFDHACRSRLAACPAVRDNPIGQILAAMAYSHAELGRSGTFGAICSAHDSMGLLESCSRVELADVGCAGFRNSPPYSSKVGGIRLVRVTCGRPIADHHIVASRRNHGRPSRPAAVRHAAYHILPPQHGIAVKPFR